MARTRTRSFKITVIGSGYVGLTTAACLSHLGHDVHCTDILPARIKALNEGNVDLIEPNLAEFVRNGIACRRLSFGTDNTARIEEADFVFLCLPTPPDKDGRSDISALEQVTLQIRMHVKSGAILINKSTVPAGTNRTITALLERPDINVASNPEFLSEGTAVFDFLHPDRIVVGADDSEAAMRVGSLYASLDAPVLYTSPTSAELIKHAANAFLATKVTFINELAALCEAIGADIVDISDGLGMDPRIGGSFLNPGPGWGGSCFPKDLASLINLANDHGEGFTFFKQVLIANRSHHLRVVERAQILAGQDLQGLTVALWGLTFKANTNDLRDSPAIAVAYHFLELGARVQAFDPTVRSPRNDMVICDDPYSACRDASVLVICTDWPLFRSIDLQACGDLMANRAIFDARNCLDAAMAVKAGFRYQAIGTMAAMGTESEDDEHLRPELRVPELSR
jgi:UDPglucose 6-dehydrogenase